MEKKDKDKSELEVETRDLYFERFSFIFLLVGFAFEDFISRVNFHVCNAIEECYISKPFALKKKIVSFGL